MLGWLCCAPVTSRVSARQPSYFFSAKPKKSNQKKGEPRPCRFAVPCATRSVRGRAKLASLELSTPLNRLRRFPLQGTTPAARQSRFRGIPGRGFASLASPEWLVRCAHLAEVGLPHPSLLPPPSSPLPPPSSPLPPHSSPLTPHPSFLTPHSSLLRPHSSPLTPDRNSRNMRPRRLP